MHGQALALEGNLEAAPDGDAAVQLGADGGVERHDLPIRPTLGLVHGQVGVVKQLVRGFLPVLTEGDADADLGMDLDRDAAALRGPGPAHHLAQPLGDAQGLIGPIELRAEHHEFIPAQTGQHIVGPDRLLHALGQGDQQLVPHLVAIGVIHLLEAVEIAEQHRHPGGVTLQVLEGCLNRPGETAPVGQAGHGAGHHLLGQGQLLVHQQA